MLIVCRIRIKVCKKLGIQSVDEGRLRACCLPKKECLDEDRVLPNVNLEGIGGPSANGLDN